MAEESALKELEELIEAYSRRLRKLRVRVALAGRDARPEDQIEVEDIQKTIADLEAARRSLSAVDRERFTSEAQELGKRISRLEEGLPLAVGFLNRLNEFSEIKARLSLPRYPPVTVVSGPMGYGKTYLLRVAFDDLKKDEWDRALLECETFVGQKGARAVMNALASEFGCGNVTDWEEIGACLGQRIAEKPGYKAALLVDGIDWLPEVVRHKALMGLDTIYRGVRAARGECRIVLSGRCIRSDLDWLAEQFADEDSLPFDQPGVWYSEIPLSEFGQDVIVDLIRRVAQREFEPWEYEVMSSNLLEITGGHPKGLVDIVVEDLDRKGWAFGKKPGTRRFYFTSETHERLFTTYMTDVVDEIKAKIGEQWWEDFQTVCLLRRFNVAILKCLIDKGAIRQFTRGEDLLQWLAERNLVRKKSPGMLGDAIARGVVVAEMKMIAGNREKYRQLNQMAADSFSGSLERLCKVYKATHTPELEAPLVAYASELVYHYLEAGKYLPPPQQPAQPLANVSAEVSRKLAPLGNELVQKFVEEITKDSEICPSREARDTVASSFLGEAPQGRGGR